MSSSHAARLQNKSIGSEELSPNPGCCDCCWTNHHCQDRGHHLPFYFFFLFCFCFLLRLLILCVLLLLLVLVDNHRAESSPVFCRSFGCYWAKSISHHLETLRNAFPLVVTRESSFQGFLGGTGFRQCLGGTLSSPPRPHSVR